MLLGGGEYLRAMIAVADGTRPSAADSEPHASLGAALKQSTVRVTFQVTDAQRRAMAEEAGGQAPVFLTLRSGALGVDVGPVVTAHAVLACDAAEGASTLARAFQLARDERAGSLAAKLVGLSSLLGRLEIEAIGKDVHAHGTASAEQLRTLLERLGGAAGVAGGGRLPEAPPGPAGAASAGSTRAATEVAPAGGSVAPSVSAAPATKPGKKRPPKAKPAAPPRD